MRPEPIRPDPSRRRAILAAVMLGTILGPIDASIVNVVLPTIARSFWASLAAAQWVPMLYLVTAGSLILFFGRLGDLWGYRRVFLAGLLGFVAASVLCAAAPDPARARRVPGLAGSRGRNDDVGSARDPDRDVPGRGPGTGHRPLRRPISVGLALGPSLGGFLAAAFGWRAAFLVNLPVGLAAFAFARRVLPDSGAAGTDRPAGRARRPRRALDVPALGEPHAAGRGRRRRRRAPRRRRRLRGSFRARSNAGRRADGRPSPLPDRAARLGCLADVLNFMSQYVVVFVTPFFLARVLQEGPARVGLVLTSFPLAVLSVDPFAGALSDRIGSVALAAGAARSARSRAAPRRDVADGGTAP